MNISIAIVWITGLSLFANFYTKKRILQDADASVKRNYLLLTGLLGWAAGTGLFLLSYYFYGNNLLYCLKLLFAYELLLAAAFIDKKLKIIPNTLILILLGGAFGFFLMELFLLQLPALVLLKDCTTGALFGAGIFLLARLFVKSGVGLGDIKLFGSLGLLLGWEGTFNLLFFSVVLSAGYGILLLLRKKADKKALLPMAPFVFAGMAVIMIMGV